MRKITQRSRILQYMQDTGSITRLEAATEVGCFELAARLDELRKEGWHFLKQRLVVTNRYGDKVRVVRYYLVLPMERGEHWYKVVHKPTSAWIIVHMDSPVQAVVHAAARFRDLYDVDAEWMHEFRILDIASGEWIEGRNL